LKTLFLLGKRRVFNKEGFSTIMFENPSWEGFSIRAFKQHPANTEF